MHGLSHAGAQQLANDLLDQIAEHKAAFAANERLNWDAATLRYRMQRALPRS